MVGISVSDITDNEINDSFEQLSDGYMVYGTGIVNNCNSLTKTITIIPLSNFNNLINGDSCIQSKDRIYIYNSTNADGYYTINTIISGTQFTVFENILNSINGNILYMHPSGASKIGFDHSKSKNITANTVQKALEQLDGIANSSSNKITIRKNSTSIIGIRPKLNFCEGFNTTLTLLDDSVNDEVVIAVSTSIPTIAIRKNSLTNIGSKPRLNFIDSLNTTVTAIDDSIDNEIDLTINSKTTVRKNNNIAVGTRSRLNFCEGSGITITTEDDSVNDEIDLTITSVPKKSITIQFVLPESISGIEQWYYFSNWPGAANNKARSGHNSGITSAGNCIPCIIPFTGIITQCTCILKSSGTRTSTVIYPVNFTNRLQLVTFTSISTLNDIVIPISNSYIVGANTLGNTNFVGFVSCNIAVTQGDLLALKFINGFSNNQISRMLNSYISLTLEES
jgi:hypothetical protein